MILTLLFAGTSAVALPPPPQRTQSYGSIPSQFGGMLLSFPFKGVAASEIRCSAKTANGKMIEISASIDAVVAYASQAAAPNENPHPWVKIKPHPTHEFSGSYESTFSNSEAAHYGLMSGLDGVTYYIGFDTFRYSKPGSIVILTVEDSGLTQFATGNCAKAAVVKRTKKQ